MTSPTLATATPFQRVQMLEEALEKVLDRGPEMSVEAYAPGEAMHVYVIANPWGDGMRTAYSLHTIAREMEALLP